MYIEIAKKAKRKYIYWILTFFIVFMSFSQIGKDPLDSEQMKQMSEQLGGAFNLFAFNLLSFVPIFLFMLFIIVKVHKLSLTEFFTSRKKIDFSRILFSVNIWGLILIVQFVFSIFFLNENYKFNFDLVSFVKLFFVGFVLISIQTSCEEILFRGYLMQGLNIIFNNRIVPFLLSSVVFAFMHYLNPEVGEYGTTMLLIYLACGLTLGAITLIDGGLELALGYHFVNNFLSCIIVSDESSVFGTIPALFSQNSVNINVYNEIILAFVSNGIFLYVMSKKYNWKNIKEKIL